MYNRNIPENTKIESFSYNRKVYPAGTELVYTGWCSPLGERRAIELNNRVVKYMYYYDNNHYFIDDKQCIYTCHNVFFYDYIMQIGKEPVNRKSQQVKNEHYWTDEDVAKTLWYIAIMLFATIFNDNVGIWIFATIVWGCSVFGKKK